MEQQPPADPKAASSYSSTTVTSTTGAAAEPQPSAELLVVTMLQGELHRKLLHLQDVHKAYEHLMNHWTEEKNWEAAAVHQNGFIVQRCWLKASTSLNYRDGLECAVDKLEREIWEMRLELQSIAKCYGGRN
ncbi:hypothetical protein BGZ96_008792 [Linnemannia gamsii]|uniref:Uncharacterized protein n=1 Tax=Linnemannia gamsii TaxID=64522 RepID=A0ABQ7JYB9_9FUNG|nr:hypothetical protein BGZ96_008792 [Linnemannia gamsii]